MTPPSEKQIEARQKVTDALYELMRVATEITSDEMISDWALIVHTSSMTDVEVSDYYTLSMSGNCPPHIMEGLFMAGAKFAWETEDEEG